jgi:hypothetical protein
MQNKWQLMSGGIYDVAGSDALVDGGHIVYAAV